MSANWVDRCCRDLHHKVHQLYLPLDYDSRVTQDTCSGMILLDNRVRVFGNVNGREQIVLLVRSSSKYAGDFIDS